MKTLIELGSDKQGQSGLERSASRSLILIQNQGTRPRGARSGPTGSRGVKGVSIPGPWGTRGRHTGSHGFNGEAYMVSVGQGVGL